jgi:glycosyltransferase involved in cell wall biosynthesis
MEKNKISVVMCTYNGAKYLREQMASIVHQSYPIHELVIQDDCSTDNTFDILRKYADMYPFIHLYQNEHRKGINENFFSAIERATGDFVAISDQDDIWELDKIRDQIEAIGDNWICSGFSKSFSKKWPAGYLDDRIPNYAIERLIYIGSAIPGHTLLIKKAFLPTVLNIHPIPTFILYDHLISIVAASYNKISFVAKVLVHHREHTLSATLTVPVMKRGGNNKSIRNMAASFFRTLFFSIEIREKIRFHFLLIYQLLQSLPEKDSVKADAQRMAYYQSKKGLIAYMKLTILCVKLRKKIFYTEEKSAVLSVLRAIYFPVSCSDYFRYMSKSHKKG